MNNLKICLLASGGLGLKILKHIDESDYDLISVFTDYKSNLIMDYCKEQSIPLFKGNPRNGKAKLFLQEFECELVLSVNYLFIIENDLITKASKYAINIHGSKLPKYRGRTPHVWAIINGESEAGITAHIIDENLDHGDIIEQINVPIDYHDTGADMLAKFHKLYPVLVDNLCEKIKSNTIVPTPQDQTMATYFGKRSPEDGQINWDWHKERIRNWIRAQAHPYPGAFTFFNGEKIIIHKAEFSQQGFNQSHENGEVLARDSRNIIVKTNNGALNLSEIENELPTLLVPGKILK